MDKLFQYLINTKVNSAFHLSTVGKSSTGWDRSGIRLPVLCGR